MYEGVDVRAYSRNFNIYSKGLTDFGWDSEQKFELGMGVKFNPEHQVEKTWGLRAPVNIYEFRKQWQEARQALYKLPPKELNYIQKWAENEEAKWLKSSEKLAEAIAITNDPLVKGPIVAKKNGKN